MRSSNLNHHEIVPIVVLSPQYPPDEDLNIYKEFPEVYFMTGDYQKVKHLKRANFMKTSRIVLLDLYESDDVNLVDDTATMYICIN
jgi:hypothetical protein